jgi:hypothetical protein
VFPSPENLKARDAVEAVAQDAVEKFARNLLTGEIQRRCGTLLSRAEKRLDESRTTLIAMLVDDQLERARGRYRIETQPQRFLERSLLRIQRYLGTMRWCPAHLHLVLEPRKQYGSKCDGKCGRYEEKDRNRADYRRKSRALKQETGLRLLIADAGWKSSTIPPKERDWLTIRLRNQPQERKLLERLDRLARRAVQVGNPAGRRLLQYLARI